MRRSPQNWVFLGDSLTEGIGSSRISYVSEFTTRLRALSRNNGQKLTIHELRLRMVDPGTFDRFVQFNLAGYFNQDEPEESNVLWLWNLASEGQQIDADFDWLPILRNLNPEVVVVFRGSLESIVRPAMLQSGDWPWWIPQQWRSYAAMDPRCYFSTSRLRRIKQSTIDTLKQKARIHLLQRREGCTLLETEKLMSQYQGLLRSVRELQSRVIVLGLLPVNPKTFPGSTENFNLVNERIRQVAEIEQAEFVDWGKELQPELVNNLYYRDGFHPNRHGARALAAILEKHLPSPFLTRQSSSACLVSR